MPITPTLVTPEDLAGLSAALSAEIARLSARVAALEGRPADPPVVHPSPPPVIETPASATDDDLVFAGDAMDLPAIAPGGTLDITGKRYRLTHVPNNVTITGRGELLVPVSLQAGPVNWRVRGAVITGTKLRRQCSVVRESLAAEFDADVLTLAPGEVRTSAPIALDPGQRYGIDILPGFVKGDNALPIKLLRCDSSGRVVGEYNPQDAGAAAARGNWCALLDCAALRVQISAARIAGVSSGPTFDLSKVRIYGAVNDLALMGLSPFENQSQVYLQGGNLFEDVLFRDLRLTPMKVVSGADNIFRRVTVRHCLSGFSTQSAVGTIWEDCDIDVRCLDDHGGLVPSGLWFRNRCLSIGHQDAGARITRGSMRGASWAIEAFEGNGPPTALVIDGTTIDAVHYGVSNNARQAVTRNVSISLGPLGYVGAEHNLTASFRDSTISMPEAAMQSYGLAHANDMSVQTVERVRVTAGIGAQFYSAQDRQTVRAIRVQDCEFAYTHAALSWNVPGVTVKGNVGRRTGYYAMRDADVSALRQLSASGLTDEGGNKWT